MKEEHVTLNIRIPRSLKSVVELIAYENERPMGYVVRKALEEHLKEDIEQLDAAMAIANNPNAKYYTSEEMASRWIKRKTEQESLQNV
jgi:predicted DNA-binding protein